MKLKNVMTGLVMVLLVGVLAVGLTACGDNSKGAKITAGTYELTAATDSTGEIDMLETFKTTAMMMQKVRVDGDKVYMTIRTQAGAEQEVEGGVKYTLNGETIKGDDLTGTWKYKDGKIIVEANNAILTYTKA